jgi:hypothetical protein
MLEVPLINSIYPPIHQLTIFIGNVTIYPNKIILSILDAKMKQEQSITLTHKALKEIGI